MNTKKLGGVIITGASGGIGRAICFSLVFTVSHIMIIGRNQKLLIQLAEELKKKDHMLDVQAVVADLTDTTSIQSVADAAEKKGCYQILINNAGDSDFQRFDMQNVNQIEQLVRINLLAPMYLSQKILPLFKSQSEAQIINIGSVFGDIGYPGFTAYCATKFGLRGFTQALRRELCNTLIRVRYFAPRATLTNLNSKVVIEMNEKLNTTMDSPEDVAKSFMRFLFSHSDEYVLGWPERLFVLINRLRYQITDAAIAKQMPIIRKFLFNSY
jgi:short-subunit dehydrogenase